MTSATATPARTPVEEIRLATVLNGGVSLVVLMGGVVQELNPLTWAESESESELDGRVRGGAGRRGEHGPRGRDRWDLGGGHQRRGAGSGPVTETAQLARLLGLWVEQGNIDALLREFSRGQPTSLLQGDEFFLEQFDVAMTALSSPFERTGRPVDLTLATTHYAQ